MSGFVNATVITCPGCGEPLDIVAGQSIVTCKVCGNKNIIPKMITPERQEQFERANRFRINGEFDRAEQSFEDLVKDMGDNAELYWSILLCKYGVLYQKEGNRVIPTLQRMQTTPILEDNNYKYAIEYATEEEKAIYEEQAAEISAIQNKYFEIIRTEKPYDIFISYKETDATGERTHCSVLAQEIYDKLNKEGYKVFFSRITLETKIGQEYEPYIYAALQSAKVMLLVSTNVDNMNSMWVKNEWTRFLHLMNQDSSKKLITAYKGINPYDFPSELKNIQGQDMNKIGAEQDLLRGISKFFEINKTNTVTPVSTQSSPTVDNYLTVVMDEISRRNYEKATQLLEQAQLLNPRVGKIYLYKLFIKLQVTGTQAMWNYLNNSSSMSCMELFENDQDYLKFLEYSSDKKLKHEMQELCEAYKKHNEIAIALQKERNEKNAALEKQYKEALDGAYKSTKTAKQAIVKLEAIKDFKDSSEHIDSLKYMIHKNKRILVGCILAPLVLAIVLGIIFGGNLERTSSVMTVIAAVATLAMFFIPFVLLFIIGKKYSDSKIKKLGLIIFFFIYPYILLALSMLIFDFH